MKRNAAAVLWFLAVWTMAGTATSLMGLPVVLAAGVGILVGALVWADPGGRLWQASSDAAIRRRRVADLARVTGSSGEGQPQREAEPAPR